MSLTYILTKEAMPGLVKIGVTSVGVSGWIQSLDRTSVHMPSDCYFAVRVEDMNRVELELNTAFGQQRVRVNREFF